MVEIRQNEQGSEKSMVDKSNLLIQSKLHLPFIRTNLVSRPQLKMQIMEGLRGPLTLVTAPAGFGKTTLVASVVAECGLPYAWLSLDKNDNLPGRFLTYLIAALQSIDPRIGRDVTGLMTGVHPMPSELLLTGLINDVVSTGKEMVLVLDDYQMITNPLIHEQMAFLLEHCPRTLHLIISTRADPLLPLSRWRGRGHTLELRAVDLRFSETEAIQFLNEVMGLSLDAISVGLLEERTEGWVAGLQMAALSMRDHKDVAAFIQGFSGTNRYILDYLLEEVLANQPPEVQHFLLNTSILEYLTASLCDAVLLSGETQKGEFEGKKTLEQPVSENSASILEYLERVNLFLVPLDAERQWYRYHHLFADLLRARLSQTLPESIPLLHIRASGWLEKKGFIHEAIQHLFTAHEPGRAADLIEPHASARWVASDLSVVQMADSLPQELLITRPKLGLYLAWLLIIQGYIGRAIPLLEALDQQLANAGRNDTPQWVQTIVVLALVFLNRKTCLPDFDPLVDERILDGIPADEMILQDAADILFGMALARRGEIDRAVEISERNIKMKKTPHGISIIPTLLPFLARLYLTQGRLHEAASLCRKNLDFSQENSAWLVPTAGSLSITLGDVLYEWNLLDEAEQLIREGLKANQYGQNILTEGFGLVALVRVLQAKGNFEEALQRVEQFEARMRNQALPSEFREDFYTLRVRLSINNGDFKSAAKWAELVRQTENDPIRNEYYRLPLARICFMQGRNEEAEELLAVVPGLKDAGNRINRQIEVFMLRAAALLEQQHLPDALQLVEASLSLAEEEGYVRAFLDLGKPAQKLLSVYLNSDFTEHKVYVQKLLNAFSPSPFPASLAKKQPLFEPLSSREVEVLQLMALGRTNREIAEQLIVAPGTIKAHAASIYRKLDAVNRTEAVANARKLGILS